MIFFSNGQRSKRARGLPTVFDRRQDSQLWKTAMDRLRLTYRLSAALSQKKSRDIHHDHGIADADAADYTMAQPRKSLCMGAKEWTKWYCINNPPLLGIFHYLPLSLLGTSLRCHNREEEIIIPLDIYYPYCHSFLVNDVHVLHYYRQAKKWCFIFFSLFPNKRKWWVPTTFCKNRWAVCVCVFSTQPSVWECIHYPCDDSACFKN